MELCLLLIRGLFLTVQEKHLKEAHANGHLIFINSGRIYAMIPSIIKEMGFDGYVCGCGSQIYMNDKLLFSSMIPNDLCRETIEKITSVQKSLLSLNIRTNFCTTVKLQHFLKQF